MAVAIDNLPNDDIERVVWAHGKLLKNDSAYSSNPQVQVALVEIGPNTKISKNKSTVVNITIAELDTVRLGTIWKKKACVGLYKNYEKHEFSFDFSPSNINSINFCDGKPNTINQYYIPPYKHDLSGLKTNEEKVPYENFSNSKLTHLFSNKGVNVFIPALELFTSTYSSDKEIRRKLITNDVDQVINHYLIPSRCYEEPVSGNYITSFVKDNIKHVKNRKFLGYLRLNKETRIRVSKIWTNLSINEHPQIEPYHPHTMKLKVDGIWLDSTKNNYLVLRINGCSLPAEHEVIPEIPANTTNPKREHSDYTKKHYKEVEVDINIPITSEIDPSKFQGTAYITSDVDIIGDIPDTRIITREHETKSCNHDTLDSDVASLSSGDSQWGIGNAQTATVSTKEPDSGDIIDVLNDTYDALEKLRRKEKLIGESTKILELSCYDTSNRQYKSKFLTTFSRYLIDNENENIGSWPSVGINKSRKVLLCRIKLGNNKKAFLLEIERKKSESYKGLLFNTETGYLSLEIIKELFLTIAKNKGQLTHGISDPNNNEKNIHTEIDFPSSIISPFAFKHGRKDKTYSRMITIISEAIGKEVFTD